MNFDGVLTESERDRAERTLRKLSTHDISRWALAGGIAAEIHIRRRGGRSAFRPLHDRRLGKHRLARRFRGRRIAAGSCPVDHKDGRVEQKNRAPRLREYSQKNSR